MTLVIKAFQLPRLVGDRIAFDLETDDPGIRDLGPGWRRDGRVLGIAVAVPGGKTWYVPVDGSGISSERVWQWCAAQLKGRMVYGASIDYDLDYAYQNGVPVPAQVRDVLHAGRLCDLQGKYPSLDELLKKYLPQSGGKTGSALWEWLSAHRGRGEATRDAQIGYLKLAPPALVGEYAEGDVRELFELHDRLEVKLKERHAWEWYQVEEELLPYLLHMRIRGIRVNVAEATRLQERFGAEYGDLLNKFGGEAYPDLWGKLTPAERVDMLSENKTAQLARAYATRGITLPATALGHPSVTKAWLQDQDDPFSKMVLRLRALSKVTGTFVDAYILKHQVCGRIHPELKQLFPRTLRMSGRNPNEQNIPSRDEVLAPMIRGLFLPEEGEDWGRADYSQQEYRLATHFGVGQGAEAARQAYRDNPRTDFHELVMGWLGNELPRKTVKNANFAKVYRAGKAKFAQTLGVERDEGDRVFDLYDRMLPWIKATAATAERIAEQRGYVNLLLRGMRMYFDHWAVDDWDLRNAGDAVTAKTYSTREEAVAAGREAYDRREWTNAKPRIRKADVYKALNRVIQPSGAQLMKMGMVLLARSGVTAVLGPALVSVHDELGFSVPRTAEGREAFAEAVRCLERSDEGRCSVPTVVSMEHGPDWGHLVDGPPRARKKLKQKAEYA